jgi:hypothetical protein
MIMMISDNNEDKYEKIRDLKKENWMNLLCDYCGVEEMR